jgi:Uma2 family endonuclease
MGMAAPIYYTADMVRTLLDEERHWPRYEVVYGELLVTIAPRLWHQEVVGRLFVALRRYLERHPVGLALTSPSEISWGPDVLVQPDVFVVTPEEARTLDWAKVRRLMLIAEVLSPSTTRNDRFTKRRRYQEEGVPRYWIVDADEHQVEVWTPGAAFPAFERERLVWHPEGATTPFTLGLDELFRPL